jgi:aspartate/methionine/tyrosine aminotransferase
VDPDTEVQLLVGSQEGTAHLPLAVLNPGDAALLLDPYYPSHMGGLHLASAEPVLLPLDPAAGWKPDFSAVDATTWQRLKLMVLGFPHNPTATTGEQAWLDAAVERAVEHGIVLAHDNPYVDLALDGEAPALLRNPAWRQCGIEFFSFSKSWCLGGFRLAFAIGAADLIAGLRQLKGVVDFNQSLALQAGAIAALEQAGDWPERLKGTYRERRDRMAAALEAIGWPVPIPSMALYLWLPLPPLAQARGWDSETFCAALLEATGVALTPGNGFGPGGEGWARLALVHPVEDLEAGAARIGGWFQQLAQG